jgi:Flp pilus assembly pilin Flp
MQLVLHRLLMSVSPRLKGERGQTMAEYALLIGVIALVVLAAAVFLGSSISSLFSSTSGHI